MKFIKRSWMSLCLGILVLFNVSCTGKKAASEDKDEVLSYSNPLSVQFGDPYVLLASDGRYYMYGTGAGAVDGFCAYSSDDLIHWKTGRAGLSGQYARFLGNR